MRTTTEEVLEKIRTDLSKNVKNVTILIFGSVARGDDKPGSDIDLCVICNKSQKKRIANRLMQIGKDFDRSIQIVFTDRKFTGLDHTFVETVLREGVSFIGKAPDVTLNRLKLDPYRLIRYDIKGLTKKEKMRLRRLLYGIKTKKRYKNKMYVNIQKGMIDVTGGLRTGIASVIIPEKEARKVEDLLKENGAIVQSFPVWMSKI